MKVGEVKVANNKRRSVLKVLSPLPMVSGKGTLEMDGLHSQTRFTDPMPEFYLRLSEEQRFGMIKMSEHNGNRVLEKLTIIPVTNEIVEEPEIVQVARQYMDLFRMRQHSSGILLEKLQRYSGPGSRTGLALRRLVCQLALLHVDEGADLLI